MIKLNIYLCSRPVKKIFDMFGFDLIDVVPQKFSGGSMRYVISRKNDIKLKKV